MKTKLKRPMTDLYPHIQMFIVMALRQQAPGSSENQARLSPSSPALIESLSSQTSSGWETTALISHIIWGWEMLTDRQVTKWQSEFILLGTWAMARNVSNQFHRAGWKQRTLRECEGGAERLKGYRFPSSITCSLKLSLVPVPLESLQENKNLKSRRNLGKDWG